MHDMLDAWKFALDDLSKYHDHALRHEEQCSSCMQCILAEGAIALSVTLSGGALFAS